MDTNRIEEIDAKMRKKNKIYLVIGIIVVIIVGVGGFIFAKNNIIFKNSDNDIKNSGTTSDVNNESSTTNNDSSSNSNNNQNSTSENNSNLSNSSSENNSSVEPSNEIILTDNNVIKKLKDNYDVLNYYWLGFYISDDWYIKDYINASSISNRNKTITVFRYLLDDNEIEIYSGDSKIKKYVDENEIPTEHYIEYSTINNRFKEIFDGNPSTSELTQDTAACFYPFYNKEFSVYFAFDQCGGPSGPSTYSYIYKYSYVGDEYYIYNAVGHAEIDENNSSIYNIYTSYMNNNIIEKVSAGSVGYDNNYINASNYKSFDHFKFTFKKNSSGNYIFQSVERIKD